MAEEKKEKIPVRNAERSDADGEVSQEGKKLIEIIKRMKIADLNSTVKAIEEEFGVSAQAPMATVPQAGDAASTVEEKSAFNIVLTAVGDKKIEVIKVVRDVTGKGLKEAKDLVDAAAASPQMVKENAKKEEAEDIKKKLEVAGAKVELK